MKNIRGRISKWFGGPEKAALASSAVLITLDLMGGSGLFSFLGSATKLTESGLGKTIGETLRGSLANYLPGLFERLHSSKEAKDNHTNFILFVDATQKCLDEVRNWFVETYQWGPTVFGSAPNKEKAKQLFDQHLVTAVIEYFNSEKVSQLFETNQQLNPASFIEWAFDQSVDFNKPELQPYQEQAAAIRSTFCSVFRSKFLEQIRIQVSDNPVLRDSYHTFLMHQIVLSYDDLKKSSKEDSEKLVQALLLLEKNLGNRSFVQHKELMGKVEHLTRQNEEIIAKARDYFRANSLPYLQYVVPREEQNKNALGYSYRNTKYVGRADILFDMTRFINHTDSFKWAMISGSAGQGKSRLAQELCDLYYQMGWHVGFCRVEEQNYSWNQFDPSQANGLLIVLDYISGKEDIVERFLKNIALCMREKEAKKEYPGIVRVLVLEREFSKDWLERVPYMDHVTECLFKKEKGDGEASYFKLAELEDQDLLALIADVVKKEFTEEESRTILFKLAEIDKERRPLIAFILGLYIRQNGIEKGFVDWKDITDALGSVLKRESDLLKKIPVWNSHNDLARASLFVTALVQEIPATRLMEALRSSAMMPDEAALSQLHRLYEATNNFKKKFRADVCYGFQPDLIAEYYVVNHLATADEEEATCLLDLSLGLLPEATSAMLAKTEQNFFAHRGFGCILKWIEEKVNQGPQLDLKQARLLAQTCYILLQNNGSDDGFNIDKVLRYFNYLKDIQLAFPEENDIARLHSRAALTLNYYYIQISPDIVEAKKYLDNHILPLRMDDKFPGDIEIAVRQLLAAKNIVWRCLKSESADTDLAVPLFNQHILSLAMDSRFAGDKSIVGNFAIAAGNFVWHYTVSAAPEIEKAKEYFDNYLLPLKTHKTLADDRDVVFAIANSTAHLIYYYVNGKNRDAKLVNELLTEHISSVRQQEKFADDREIATQHIHALYYIIWGYRFSSEANNMEAVRPYFEDYIKLRDKFGAPDDLDENLRNWVRQVFDFSEPPLWKEVYTSDEQLHLRLIEKEKIVQDERMWTPEDKLVKAAAALYLPLLTVKGIPLNDEQLKETVASALEVRKDTTEIRANAILGGMKYELPFYPGCHLVHVLCYNYYTPDPDERFDPGVSRLQLLGYMTFVVNEKDGSYKWLNGRPTAIYELNALAPIQITDVVAASEYLRFFCAFVHGDRGAFSIIQSPYDVLFLDMDQLSGLEKDLTRLIEQQTFERTDGGWLCTRVLAYGSSLFTARFSILDSGVVEMLDNEPYLHSIPRLSPVFNYGLKTFKSVENDSALQ